MGYMNTYTYMYHFLISIQISAQAINKASPLFISVLLFVQESLTHIRNSVAHATLFVFHLVVLL